MNQDKLRSDVAAAEGCRLVAYKDSLGYWTIGYGRLMTQSGMNNGFTITQDQAEKWLTQDLATAYAQAQELVEWASLDTDARQNAVVELVFNMGVNKWRAFVRARMAMVQKGWVVAHDELLNSLWAKQVHGRSTRIATYILTGSF